MKKKWDGVSLVSPCCYMPALTEIGDLYQDSAFTGSVTDEEMDSIYDLFDEAMLAGNFTALNLIIKNLRAAEMERDLAIAILTLTLPAKSKLPSREIFLQVFSKRGDMKPNLLRGLI